MRKFFVPAALVLSLFAAACAPEETEPVEEEVQEAPEVVEPAPAIEEAPAEVVDTAALEAPPAEGADAEAPGQH